MAGKRKWQEQDWDVLFAAQSFVAVLASPGEEEAPEKKKKKSAKKNKKKTPTRRSPRARRAEEEKKEEEKEKKDVDMDAPQTPQVDEFWLAQLQDDVTEDMLAQEDVSVHVTWLNRTAASRYEFAYDEQVDVSSILCHVFLRELSATALELTPKSLARVQRSLSRTKRRLAGEDVAEDEGEEEDNERPPPALSTSSRKRRTADDGKPSSASARGRGGAAKTQKLSKKEADMHIPPLRTTVDETKYEDRELFGTQPLEDFSGDVASANREVVRAVLTKNVKMLKKLTTKAEVYAGLSTFDAARSADVAHTALHYAIDNDDLTAAALLRQTDEKVEKQQLAAAPEVALPSHSTGQHTSRFSDYNRRAINASRGGKEGNNALLGDGSTARAATLSPDYLWRSPNASIEMLTLLYPTGGWTNGYAVGNNVCHSARVGNYHLVRKVVETLEKNGGWGFNELHHKVLADGPSDKGPLLPLFRVVSAIKQANQTRLRPLHLAAINPNTKYLEALWDVAGDEFSAIKDDQGYEPIHYAAGCESPAPMIFLLEKRCSMFGRTKTRLTPLMCALEAGREETALALLKFAATPGESGGGGQEVTDKLIREKGPGGKQAVHFAARHGCAKVLEYLLIDCGEAVEVNAASGGTSKATPLAFAAQNGHLECVRVLLANGARVDAGDKLKKTPLILAVKNGHTRVAALLINGGANVNAYDTSENSVAHYAASYGWPSCLQLLCDVGAELWSQNAWGFVPLACALLKQRRACAELILAQVSGEAQQKFLDFRDRQGRTMLFLQCQHSHCLDQISYLLDKGLNPNISDSDGEYPLQRLIKRACDSTVKSRVGGVNRGGENMKFYVEAVRLLIERGALLQYDLFLPDLCHVTRIDVGRIVFQPLQQAMIGKQVEIVELLLDQNHIRVNELSPDGTDAWMTASSLGAGIGDIFLSKLLAHHAKTSPSGPLLLEARSQSSQENFFHFIAHHSAPKLSAVPKLIRQCCERCPTTQVMMRERDSQGYTPIMRLLDPKQERGVLSEKNEADPSKIQLMRDVDERFAYIFELYLERTTMRESFVRLLRAEHVQGVTELSGNEIASVSLDFESGLNANIKNEVEYETILHQITVRQLISTPRHSWFQWYGPNLVEMALQVHPELFTDSDEAGSSLVNFKHLGTFKTALHLAVEGFDLPTARLLLIHGADANLSPVRCSFCQAFATKDTFKETNGEFSFEDCELTCTGNCGTRALVRPALFVAVKGKFTEMVDLLLKYGSRPDCISERNQETPLHVALRLNDPALVTTLLAHGADLAAKDRRGYSPLHAAVIARHAVPATEAHSDEVAYVRVTQASTSKYSPENIGYAVELSQNAGAQYQNKTNTSESGVLVALRDADAQSAAIQGDCYGRSPVHFAARYRNLELLGALLQAAGTPNDRIAVNQGDSMGRTPLHYAVNMAVMSAESSFAIERFLLQSGANVNAQDTFGFSALHYALLKVDLDWLSNYDANHQRDADESIADYDSKKRGAFLRTQLQRIPAHESDPVETVSNLVAVHGVDIITQDALGRSPLHLAAGTGAFVCVSTLLSALGDLNQQKTAMSLEDVNGFTPLGYAVLHKRQTVIMTLLRSGSEVDGKLRIQFTSSSSHDTAVASCPGPNMKSRSYFYHAVNHGLTGICHMLLSAKFSRRQALEDAIRCGQFQLANNLLGVVQAGRGAGRRILQQSNTKCETLLHSLAKMHQIGFNSLAKKLAWALVDAGVRVDAHDDKGNLALHYAAKRGNTMLMDFLHHQSGGKGSENCVNKRGETPLLFTLKQKRRAGGLAEDAMLATFCYFLDHPRFSVDLSVIDSSGMNVLCAFLDRFIESLVFSKPVVFFTWIELLLKRGADPNLQFQSVSAATLQRTQHVIDHDDDDRLTQCRWEPCEMASLAKGDGDKMPPLIRAAITPDLSVRYHTLALLLRYGAKLTAADGRGNTLLMHLASRNLVAETRLALGLVRLVPEPKDVFSFAASTRVCSLHVPEASVKTALTQQNTAGLTACHMAVQPLDYGSYENTRLLAMLVRAGGDLRARDGSGKSVIDYARDQRSYFVLRFLQQTFPEIVTDQSDTSEHQTVFAAAPAYSDDASSYLEECETSGKISRSRVVAKVNASCDVGKVSKVLCEGDGEETELDALLTKVDVKNGRFGLNVFYRLQLVHDELQGIFVLFTNWGRIGETGKFQNTPFRDEAEAVSEFKKIFRSKTGNTWESRAPGEFVKKPKKYNLVQRVNYATKVDDEVTRSFREDMDTGTGRGVEFPEPRDPDLMGSPSVMAMLAAITDVRNLQLAAQTSCGFAGGDLPLAKQDELRAALEKLQEIRNLLEEKEELVKEIGTASGDLTDEGAIKRALLATRHEALTEKVSERSSRYYEIMPCQEDSDVLASSIKAFDQVSDVNVEITRLRMLSDIMETYKMLLGAKRAQQTQNPLEYCYHALQVRLAPLQPADAERQLIHRYFFGGLRSYDRRRYRISNVFEVERRGETRRFNELMEERPDLRAMQTHLLWHGTKRTNLMGILSQGLRVAPPEAPHHGYAYGKGLYFANVAEKSLHYCDAPYALPVMGKDGKPDKSSAKAREVHYMLLCEVAMGNCSDLTTNISRRCKTFPLDGMDSVRVLAKYTPDPRGTIVSPHCGAIAQLGRTLVLGEELSFGRAWAKTNPHPIPSNWTERNPKLVDETQAYLAKLVADPNFAVGDTQAVSESDRQLFVISSDKRTVTLELIDRENVVSEGLERGRDGGDLLVVAQCEATIKVTITPEIGSGYSYSAKLYRNVFSATTLAKGYELVKPALSEYNELVVYQEAQARLRYVVEVESVKVSTG